MSWKELEEEIDPYGHWWWPKAATRRLDNSFSTKFMEQEFQSANVDLFEALSFSDLSIEELNTGLGRKRLARRFEAAQSLFGGGKWVAMPNSMLNPDGADPAEWIGEDLLDAICLEEGYDPCENLPEETLLVGIIDTGVPLHHSRTRMGEDRDKTRILASWQQSADWCVKKQAYMPFGRVAARDEIEGLLAAYNTEHGGIDEDGFNRAAGLVEPSNILGHRDLDFRASHGAHVLDLAGGMDPDGNPYYLKNVRFVVVNLPPQFLHGLAGNFLQYYASFALQWMHDLSEALWQRKFGGTNGSFPLAVNLSFGMNAGPKDGNMPFEILLDYLARPDLPRPGFQIPDPKKADSLDLAQSGTDVSPATPIKMLNVTMPAGNDNLSRKTAHLALRKGVFSQLAWRTK
mmetsp:Transcript_5193/g.8205  ORF Transcript_5193/g.8205 Transcript_5193/m.8205 type:complete len:402 (-) Transcript_5193:2-1207(-)